MLVTGVLKEHSSRGPLVRVVTGTAFPVCVDAHQSARDGDVIVVMGGWRDGKELRVATSHQTLLFLLFVHVDSVRSILLWGHWRG